MVTKRESGEPSYDSSPMSPDLARETGRSLIEKTKLTLVSCPEFKSAVINTIVNSIDESIHGIIFEINGVKYEFEHSANPLNRSFTMRRKRAGEEVEEMSLAIRKLSGKIYYFFEYNNLGHHGRREMNSPYAAEKIEQFLKDLY
jgi:hypothetical protein